MKKIFFSLVMTLALVSCSTDELSNGGTPASDKGSVQLVLSTEGFDLISRAVDESAIHDINILEYIGGTLSQVVYLSDKDFSQAVEVSGLKELPATTMTETTDVNGNKVLVPNENNIENVIFVVANYGKEITNTEDVPYYQDLKKLTMSFSGKTDMTNLPMTGFYYGGINASSTTQMNVTLQRAVAKVNFTLDTSNFAVSGEPASQVVVNSIKLCNVPGNITLYPCQDRPSLPINGATVEWNSTNGHTLFPTKDEMEADGGSVTYGDEQNQSADANTANTYTYVAYIPENVRGSYSNITDNKDKHSSKCDTSISEEDEKDENKEKSYTHILVDLNYATSDGTAKNATYRIYLGGNKTGDMNLLRNTQYNITTLLYGANTADTRITVEDITPADVVEIENANCYMIDMSDMPNVDVSKKVTIPLQQVINGWKYISSSDVSKVQTMLESGNWEIQTEWKTWDGSSHVTGTKSSDSNLKATLTIPSTVTNGHNAVVKLVSGGTTYWSWHLWFTDYKPDELTDAARHGQIHKYTSSQTKYMMDRNLGATITGVTGTISQPSSSNAKKYYGLMYQWGRKDPFIGSDGTGDTKDKLYNAQGGTYTNINSTSNGAKSLTYSVQNSGTFFYSGTSDWLSSQDSKLWGGNDANASKSVFDPCPPGWRVPLGGSNSSNPWSVFKESNFSWSGSTTTSPEKGRMYSGNGIKAWYPASGFLDCGNGTINFVGYHGYCWGASPNYQRSDYFDFSSSNTYIYPSNAHYRAYGFPVRCIQE